MNKPTRGQRHTNSKPAITARHLIEYGHISQGSALIEYGQFRLSDAIYKLRRTHRHLIPKGKVIELRMRKDANNQPYGVYHLVAA